MISVVIPTFNTAELTLSACRSVLDADEVIVVDDASTDGTAELLAREAPDVRVIRLPSNVRFAGAANAGIAAARGELVLLLNSDARVEPGAVAALRDAFTNDARLGIAGAQLINLDGSPQWSGGRLPTLAWLTVLAGGFARFRPRRRSSSAPNVDWVSGAAMMFRRELWDAIGPLRDHYLFYAQDLDFCTRAHDAGWRVRIVEHARVVHEGGATVREWRGVAQDPAMLWLDLLTWAREHRGRVWAGVARMLMIVAACVRLLLPGESKSAYVAALRQLFVKREQAARQRVD